MLNSVEQWDATSIICLSSTHRNHDNPLRHEGRLGILSGLEFAAQAMGVHVGLTRDTSQRHASIGYLGAVRDLRIYSLSFQQFPEDLTIGAKLILAQQMSFIYAFTIKVKEQSLLEGRASIFIQGTETIL